MTKLKLDGEPDLRRVTVIVEGSKDYGVTGLKTRMLRVEVSTYIIAFLVGLHLLTGTAPDSIAAILGQILAIVIGG